YGAARGARLKMAIAWVWLPRLRSEMDDILVEARKQFREVRNKKNVESMESVRQKYMHQRVGRLDRLFGNFSFIQHSRCS
ncbi:uncharacterized protein EDB91DRAFT_1189808, partial [Suillus paluster]|uniref:uncharacterized protein n=1 Tax=Suillus paluster TaxID=48578 RepID=UPI001B871DDD